MQIVNNMAWTVSRSLEREDPHKVSKIICYLSKLFTGARDFPSAQCSNLVDPASSHMLVSKIKPCMCKYKYYTAKLRMAH